MLLKKLRIAVTPIMAAALIPLAAANAFAKEQDADGRAGMWHKGTQGAPSVEACQKKVAANPQDADAQNDLGWALRQNKDLKGAEAALRTSIQLKDSSPYPHSNLSVVLLDANKPTEALAEAKKAVELDKTQPIFHAVLGNAYDATGDKKFAIAEYREALKLKPDYENAMYNLGRVLNEDGQTTEAKVALAEALKLDPDDERVMQLLDKIID